MPATEISMTFRFDDDEEAREWARKHKEYELRSPKEYHVQLEQQKTKYVVLTREEWVLLQRIMKSDFTEIKKNILNYPKKVRIVLRDWLKHFS